MYEFDLITLLRTLKAKRKRIFINCGIAAVAAIVIGFSIPKQYSSSVSLAPEMQEDGNLGGMSSLASIAGVNLNNSSDAIGPDLYPDVVSSNAFLVDLLDTQVETADGSVKTTFMQYLLRHNKRPWWGLAVGGIQKAVKSLFKIDKPNWSKQKIDPQRLTPEEEGLITRLRGIVSCSVDDNSGIISISVSAQDPLVAKTIVDTATAHLQLFITQYRTNKARNDLAYYQQLEQEAKVDYAEAQRNYAAYSDTHQDAALQSYLVKQESLENELQLAYNNYSKIRQQVQMAQAKVQEKTPAFTVVEKANVPNLPSSPRKKLIFIAFLFLAFAGTVLWIYIRLLWPKGINLSSAPTDAPRAESGGKAPIPHAQS